MWLLRQFSLYILTLLSSGGRKRYWICRVPLVPSLKMWVSHDLLNVSGQTVATASAKDPVGVRCVSLGKSVSSAMPGHLFRVCHTLGFRALWHFRHFGYRGNEEGLKAGS
jgi:hypothetical protein